MSNIVKEFFLERSLKQIIFVFTLKYKNNKPITSQITNTTTIVCFNTYTKLVSKIL